MAERDLQRTGNEFLSAFADRRRHYGMFDGERRREFFPGMPGYLTQEWTINGRRNLRRCCVMIIRTPLMFNADASEHDNFHFKPVLMEVRVVEATRNNQGIVQCLTFCLSSKDPLERCFALMRTPGIEIPKVPCWENEEGWKKTLARGEKAYSDEPPYTLPTPFTAPELARLARIYIDIAP